MARDGWRLNVQQAAGGRHAGWHVGAPAWGVPRAPRMPDQARTSSPGDTVTAPRSTWAANNRAVAMLRRQKTAQAPQAATAASGGQAGASAAGQTPGLCPDFRATHLLAVGATGAPGTSRHVPPATRHPASRRGRRHILGARRAQGDRRPPQSSGACGRSQLGCFCVSSSVPWPGASPDTGARGPQVTAEGRGPARWSALHDGCVSGAHRGLLSGVSAGRV